MRLLFLLTFLLLSLGTARNAHAGAPPFFLNNALPTSEGDSVDLRFNKNLNFAGIYKLIISDGREFTINATLVFDFSSGANFAKIRFQSIADMPSGLDAQHRIEIVQSPVSRDDETIDPADFDARFTRGEVQQADVRNLVLDNEDGTLGENEGLAVVIVGRIIEKSIEGQFLTVENQRFGRPSTERGDDDDEPRGVRVLAPASVRDRFQVGDDVIVRGSLFTDPNNGMLTMNVGILGIQPWIPGSLFRGPRAPIIPTVRVIDTIGTGGAGDESIESTLIRVDDAEIVVLVDRGSGVFEAEGPYVLRQGEDSIPIYIAPDSDLVGTPIPGGNVSLTGIYQQRDNTSPFDENYVIAPRTRADINGGQAASGWMLRR